MDTEPRAGRRPRARSPRGFDVDTGAPGRSRRAQSLAIFAVFLLFVANALGLISLPGVLGGSLRINQALLDEIAQGVLPPALVHADFLVFLAVGGVLALLLPALPPIRASLLTVLAAAAPLYLAWALPVPPPLVPLEYSLLTILVLFTVNVLIAYFVETHARAAIVAAFGQYVPPPVVAAINRSPGNFSMAGTARDMTVMFCDIRGFSSMSERLEPRELAALLNEYLTAMTTVLQRHGATIDKYVGDAVIAFWGAPLEQPDHAHRAVAAALEMQRAVAALADTFAARGWPPLRIGIGINSGVMNVGNMGSRYRIAYTVIGDAVNLAARLEALTRLYDVAILISADTHAACPTILCREIDHVRVRGKDRTTRIFEPMPAQLWSARWAQLHQEALALYYAGDWARADQCLAVLEREGPSPGYYTAMRARIAQHACPTDFSGVITFNAELSYSLGDGR